jgi:ketosteroid isomerase-like protein
MTPKEWPTQFTRLLNAGNLEAVVELYEPNARFVAPSGELVVGRWRISQALEYLVRAKANLESHVIREIVFDHIALLYTNFNGSMLDESGARVPLHFKAIEVLRRQDDGLWQLVISDPSGRTR